MSLESYFQNALLFSNKDEKTQSFLASVISLDYKRVETLLKLDAGLIFRKSSIEDKDGRTFKFINGLEYTLWSLNGFMFLTLLSHLDQSCRQLLIQYINRIKESGFGYFTQEGEFVSEYCITSEKKDLVDFCNVLMIYIENHFLETRLNHLSLS